MPGQCTATLLSQMSMAVLLATPSSILHKMTLESGFSISQHCLFIRAQRCLSRGMPAAQARAQRSSDRVQGRCAAVLLGRSSVAVLPAMTTDTLDEMVLGAGPSAGQQGLPTTVGNSCILRLAKHDIAEVASCPAWQW